MTGTIADTFKAREISGAIAEIEAGNYPEELADIVTDNWDLKERVQVALSVSELNFFPAHSTGNLPGGETVIVALTALSPSQSEMIVLNEPTDNSDTAAKEHPLHTIDTLQVPVVVISHDWELPDHADKIAELYHGSLRIFSGNSERYR